MDISIITFYTGGREVYLARAITSVIESLDKDSCNIEHHIIGQGCSLPQSIQHLIRWSRDLPIEFIIHEWPQNIGIGAGLNKIIPECKGKLIFKMDDDCRIVSDYFFDYAYKIHEKFPNSVFSPYPVGLINNPGGPRGHKHSVWDDGYIVWTKRHVTHVGGFARFAPASIMKNFQFQPDLIKGISGNEDGQFSAHCNANGTDLFYLENGLIVEHQESTLGQITRYPEYFKDRIGEQGMKFEVIE